VGESGSGKSTLISLISAYYFPQEGKVLVDDVETSKYNLTSLRKQISIVPQEISLFNDTLEMNIKYGSFDATKEQVTEACKQAHIYEYIETLPDKFETVVGERGVKLSVGQKQRIAIARAILQNPKILILDEPTSALDAITEKKITESLDLLMKERTTFIIAHRLSTVRKADKIFVFNKGEIVETGNHDELLKIKNGYYKKLHDYQIGLF
jgi:ABC-type multidrug transport system fused ATPase/permease subunit